MPVLFVHGYAVVVGVGGDTPTTVHDAQGVASLLCDPTRCAYPVGQVQVLTGEHARRDDVLAALDRLAAQARRDREATAIVFFSGHGAELGGCRLLTSGWDLRSLSGASISSTEFTERVRAIEARKLLVLLDCCYAAGMAEPKSPSLIKSSAPQELYDALVSGHGRVVMASSRRDELSYLGHPYSVFTGALLEALAGYGAFDRDGYARVLDTALWLGRKVPERSQDRQHPIIKVSNLEDNFALAHYAAGAKEPRRLTWTTSVPAFPRSLDAAQKRAHRRMLRNSMENLLLLEERMSEYAEFTAIPIQLIKDRRMTTARIIELERELGLRPRAASP